VILTNRICWIIFFLLFCRFSGISPISTASFLWLYYFCRNTVWLLSDQCCWFSFFLFVLNIFFIFLLWLSNFFFFFPFDYFDFFVFLSLDKNLILFPALLSDNFLILFLVCEIICVSPEETVHSLKESINSLFILEDSHKNMIKLCVFLAHLIVLILLKKIYAFS